MENGQRIGQVESVETVSLKAANGVVFEAHQQSLGEKIGTLTGNIDASPDHLAHIGRVVSLAEKLKDLKGDEFNTFIGGILKAAKE